MLTVRKMKDPEKEIVKCQSLKFRNSNPTKLEIGTIKITINPLQLNATRIKNKEKTHHSSIEKLLDRENLTVQHKAHVHVIKDHPLQFTKQYKLHLSLNNNPISRCLNSQYTPERMKLIDWSNNNLHNPNPQWGNQEIIHNLQIKHSIRLLTLLSTDNKCQDSQFK